MGEMCVDMKDSERARYLEYYLKMQFPMAKAHGKGLHTVCFNETFVDSIVYDMSLGNVTFIDFIESDTITKIYEKKAEELSKLFDG